MSNPALSNLARTMIFTLRVRADEQAVAWLKQIGWDKILDRAYNEQFQTGVAIRTKLFDQVAEQFGLSHRQPLVVELGAGGQARSNRVGQGRFRWVELDLPEVIGLRRQLESETVEHTFLAGSILELDWLEQLPAVTPADILFIAEGLIPFFSESQIRQLFQQLHKRLPGATIALDVVGRLTVQV